MIATFFLPGALRDQLGREALAAFPGECCGLIEGSCNGNEIRATALHPTRNLASEPDRFAIDPAAHFALLRGLRGTGREVVGCYHSHPNGRAELSPRDRESAGADDFVWLVAAIAAGEVTLAAFTCPRGAADAISPVPLAPIV
jgi:desampylase